MSTGISQMASLGGRVTMTYEQGGKIEVWSLNGLSVKVPAGTSSDEIKRLLAEKANGTSTV